jgi:hypothetical protein
MKRNNGNLGSLLKKPASQNHASFEVQGLSPVNRNLRFGMCIAERVANPASFNVLFRWIGNSK